MKKRLFLLIVIFCQVTILSGNSQAAKAQSKDLGKPKLFRSAELISPGRFKEGDEAFKLRRSEEEALKAQAFYRKAFQETPTDPEAAWRLAMVSYFVGIRMAKTDDEKEKFYTEGSDAGKAGVKSDPKCAACHFWTAINMALYAETVGMLKMLFSLNEIRRHLRASIELQPGYMYAGAYRLEGLIEWKLPGILGGSDKRAKENFEKAIYYAPHEPLNYLFYARLLDKEFKDRNGAIEMAKRGLDVPKPADDRIEAIDALERIKEFLKEHPPKKQKQK